MKKLMTALATAATALFAIGAANGDEAPLNATSFEELTLNTQLNTLADDTGDTEGAVKYWYMAPTDADNGTLVTNEVAGADVSRPDYFANQTNEKALSLDTSSPLFRHMGTSDGTIPATGEAIGDGIYLDTLVKFTAADNVFGDDALAAGDKIAISYVEREEETTTTEVEGVSQTVVTVPALTNFVIRAGGIVDGEFGAVNYIAAVPAGFKKDAWHRLTVRAIADVGDGQAGFIVYLDGDMEKALAYDTNVDAGFAKVSGTYAEKYYNNNIHAIYPSAVNVGDNKATIRAVSFSGTGAIDDVVFTKAKPSFIVESPKVTFTWDEDVTALTIGETTLTDDQLAAKSLIVDLVGTTISVEATVASGKAPRYATTGEGAWDATNGQFTGLVAGDSCSISAIVPAFEVGGIPYTTDELATVLTLAAKGTEASPVTVKLVANCNQPISLGEGEYNPDDAAYVVLDLNGKNIQPEDGVYSILNNGVNLTIINSGAAASVKVPTGLDGVGALLASVGLTTVEAGKYEGIVIGTSADQETAATLLIKGGEFIDSDYETYGAFYLAEFVQIGLTATYDSATQYVQVGGGTPQPTTYDVTYTQPANATVVTDPTTVTGLKAGATVAFKVTPDSDYTYTGVTLGEGWTLADGSITMTYTVVAGENAVTIPAPTEVVIDTYTVNVTPNANATYTAAYKGGDAITPDNDVLTVTVGQTIVITAKPGSKYEYAVAPAGWTLSEGVITIEVSKAGTVVIPEPRAKQQGGYDGGDGNKFVIASEKEAALTRALPEGKTLASKVADSSDLTYAQAYALGLWNENSAEVASLDATISIAADGKVTVSLAKEPAEGYLVTCKVYEKASLTAAWPTEATATYTYGSAVPFTPASGTAGFYKVEVVVTNAPQQ